MKKDYIGYLFSIFVSIIIIIRPIEAINWENGLGIEEIAIRVIFIVLLLVLIAKMFDGRPRR